MITSLQRSDEGAGMVSLKTAECPYDLQRLARIRRNVAMLRRLVPDMAPDIVDDDVGRLAIAAERGITYTSESAAAAYPDMPWALAEILRSWEALRSCRARWPAALGHRLRFLRYPARAWKSGLRRPPMILRHFLRLTQVDVPWVLSHGDFTEWNIVVHAPTRTVALVDWEELAFRPDFWDVFYLVFHRCVPVEELGWQTELLRRALAVRSARPESGWLHAVGVACLTMHHTNDLRRATRNPTKDGRTRMQVRRRNLELFSSRRRWDLWLSAVMR